MKVDGTHYRTIWLSPDDPSKVEIIDQRQLPHRFVIVSLDKVEAAYSAMAKAHNPFGDGQSAQRIADLLAVA